MEFVEPARSKFRRQPALHQFELVRIAAQIEANPFVDGVEKFLSPAGYRYYIGDPGRYWLKYEQDTESGWRVFDFGYPGYTK